MPLIFTTSIHTQFATAFCLEKAFICGGSGKPLLNFTSLSDAENRNV